MSECCYCGAPATGEEYSTHRDGMDEGPELPLCVGCGENDGLTCETLWARIARPDAPTRAADTRSTA